MKLFTPEYAPDGFPLLDERDRELADLTRHVGVLVVGDPALDIPARPVTEADLQHVDHYIEELELMLAQIAEMPLSNPVGIAMGQTNLSAFGENQPLDLFLAQIDPEYPDTVVDDFHEYLNFEITGESSKTIEVKHGCLSTAALSPIVATPLAIAFRAFNRYGQLIEGFFRGLPAAIAWHERLHNKAGLMVNDPGVVVVNCVPQRHVELSRKLTSQESKENWPLRYSDKQIQEILSGEHPLY